jgi:HD-like signal output (HDOD) protein
MQAAELKRILFVDDEPLLLKGLQRMLRDMRSEWDMRFVTGAGEALECLEAEPFDAVISDLRMPVMDGTRLLDEVSRCYPMAIRIVLSGEMNPDVILKTVRSTHQHLHKPCDPVALKNTLSRAFALRDILHDRKMKQLVSRIESLPSPPGLYLQILEELQSPNASFKRIGDIVARDIGMTAKILQMVNSAFFGLCRHISNPQEAVGYLGLETVKALVLSAHIFSQFSPGKIAGFDLDRLWNHSLATGVFARTIAKTDQRTKGIGDAAFLAGILHDLGKLLLACNLPEAYQAVLDSAAAEDKRALWQAENEVFGISHAEIGAYLMALWGLEDAVVEAIALHHRTTADENGDQLSTLLAAADWLEHAENNPDGAEAEWTGSESLSERLPLWGEACRAKIARGEKHV